MASFLLAGASMFFVPALAIADPTDADRATARALAAEGHDALTRQDYSTAEDRFRRADALVHAPTLVVDHARALVGLGKLAEAYRRYDLVIREGVAQTAPWAWKRALKDAEREIEALKAKLAWLSVRIQGPASPEVTINGAPVPSTELGTTRAVDPGVNKVHVTAEGFLPKDVDVEIAPGKTAEIEIELSPREAIPAEPVVLEPEPAPAPPPPPQKPKDRTLAYVAFGVGGVGLATGIATGILALGTWNDLSSECPDDKCVPESTADKKRLEDDRKRYRTFGTISGIGFGLGIAGAATGVALLLMENGAKTDKAERSLRPYFGPTSAGVYGSF